MEFLVACLDLKFSKVLKFGTIGLCFLCGLGLLQIGKTLADSHGPRQEIPYCPPHAQENLHVPAASSSIILVSTLDGTLTALDVDSGHILWKHKSEAGPLVSSTISDYKFWNGGKPMQLIPSLDGDLYTLEGEQMGSTPISAESLLSNTLKMPDDVVITGGKEMKLYGIHRKTGQVLYTCGIDACKYSGAAINDDDVVVIQRICRTVRAVSSLTGIEKWNYTVGQHEARITSPYTVNGGCHSSETKGNIGEKVLENVKFASGEGYMFVTNYVDGKQGQWDHKFTSPIVKAWHIDGMKLHQLDIFENNYHDAFLGNESETDDQKPLVYLGTYNNQPYILQSENVLKAIALEWKSNGKDLTSTPPLVTWQPYLSTAVSRTPVLQSKLPVDASVVINVKGDGESTAIGQAIGDYPFDSGFYIIQAQPINSTVEDIIISYFGNNTTEDDSIISSVWFYWKEIVCISLLLAIAINIFILPHLMKLFYCVFFYQSSEQQKIVPIETVPSAPSLLQPAIESSKSISSNSTDMVTPPTEFVSRYFTDFEPVQTLGKGGFGVVFKARNKMDDCDYAIKRISMSHKNDSKERIMREVKALAKLDHVGIVRYYNSWLESPPPDWRQPVHHLNDSGDILTPSSVFTSEELQNSFAQSAPGNGAVIGDTKDTWSNKQSSHLTNKNIGANNWKKSSPGQLFHINGGGDSLESLKFNKTDLDVSSRDNSDDSFIKFENSHDGSGIPTSGTNTSSVESSATSTSNSNFSIQFKETTESATSSDSKSCIQSKETTEKSAESVTSSASDSCIQSKETTEKSAESVASSDSDSIIQFKGTTESNPVPKTASADCDDLPLAANIPVRPLFKSYLYIQMQLCRKDSLKDWLRCNTNKRDKFETLGYFNQITSAVEYVHDQGLMHRDLKPSNIFFAMDGAIKIGDFGLVATMLPSDDTIPNDPLEGFPAAMSHKHTNQVGTRLYMSPEQLAEEAYDYKVDIFSLGLILFELLVSFSTEMERMKVMTLARDRKFPRTFVEEFKDESILLNKMLSHSSKDRPCATEIRQDAILQDFQPRPSFLRHVRSRSMSRTYSTSSSCSSGNSGNGLSASSNAVLNT